MAELVATKVGDRISRGRYVQQTFRVTAGAAAATEWFATGFKTIIAILGIVPIGTTAVSTVAKKNVGTGTTGTSGTEGDNHGSVAVEASAGSDLEVTVLAEV
jgi:hypothetical protein